MGTDTQAFLTYSGTQMVWMIYKVTATRTVVPITKTIYHTKHAHLRIMCNLLVIVRATLPNCSQCKGHFLSAN